MFNDLKWEVAVHFVDIGGIVHHNYLNPFLITSQKFYSIIAKIISPKFLVNYFIFETFIQNKFEIKSYLLRTQVQDYIVHSQNPVFFSNNKHYFLPRFQDIHL